MVKATIATLVLSLGIASAFGPHVPVTAHKNAGKLTMKIGAKDLLRRQRFNKIVLRAIQPNPTKEHVETILSSEETSRLIQKVRQKCLKRS